MGFVCLREDRKRLWKGGPCAAYPHGLPLGSGVSMGDLFLTAVLILVCAACVGAFLFYLFLMLAPGPATGLLMWALGIRGRLRYDWQAEAWRPADR